MATADFEQVKDIVTKYGDKQTIGRMAAMGMIEPTTAVLAGMMIDRITQQNLAGKAPTSTVAQDVFAPPGPMLPGGDMLTAGAPPMPQQPMPQQPMPQQPMPQQPQQPEMMRAGGVAMLPVPDQMYEYKGGGIVAFQAGGLSEEKFQERMAALREEERRREQERAQVEARARADDARLAAIREEERRRGEALSQAEAKDRAQEARLAAMREETRRVMGGADADLPAREPSFSPAEQRYIGAVVEPSPLITPGLGGAPRPRPTEYTPAEQRYIGAVVPESPVITSGLGAAAAQAPETYAQRRIRLAREAQASGRGQGLSGLFSRFARTTEEPRDELSRLGTLGGTTPARAPALREPEFEPAARDLYSTYETPSLATPAAPAAPATTASAATAAPTSAAPTPAAPAPAATTTPITPRAEPATERSAEERYEAARNRAAQMVPKRDEIVVPSLAKAVEERNDVIRSLGGDPDIFRKQAEDLRLRREELKMDRKEAANLRLLEAGLAILGGTSPYAFVNIGKGASQAMQGFAKDVQDLRKSRIDLAKLERDLGLAQTEFATKQTDAAQAKIAALQKQKQDAADKDLAAVNSLTKSLLDLEEGTLDRESKERIAQLNAATGRDRIETIKETADARLALQGVKSEQDRAALLSRIRKDVEEAVARDLGLGGSLRMRFTELQKQDRENAAKGNPTTLAEDFKQQEITKRLRNFPEAFGMQGVGASPKPTPSPTPPTSSTGNTVTVGGKTYNFPSEEAANQFRARAGIQ